MTAPAMCTAHKQAWFGFGTPSSTCKLQARMVIKLANSPPLLLGLDFGVVALPASLCLTIELE